MVKILKVSLQKMAQVDKCKNYLQMMFNIYINIIGSKMLRPLATFGYLTPQRWSILLHKMRVFPHFCTLYEPSKAFQRILGSWHTWVCVVTCTNVTFCANLRKLKKSVFKVENFQAKLNISSQIADFPNTDAFQSKNEQNTSCGKFYLPQLWCYSILS